MAERKCGAEADRDAVDTALPRRRGAVASSWEAIRPQQSEGQGFDSPQLHCKIVPRLNGQSGPGPGLPPVCVCTSLLTVRPALRHGSDRRTADHGRRGRRIRSSSQRSAEASTPPAPTAPSWFCPPRIVTQALGPGRLPWLMRTLLRHARWVLGFAVWLLLALLSLGRAGAAASRATSCRRRTTSSIASRIRSGWRDDTATAREVTFEVVETFARTALPAQGRDHAHGHRSAVRGAEAPSMISRPRDRGLGPGPPSRRLPARAAVPPAPARVHCAKWSTLGTPFARA